MLPNKPCNFLEWDSSFFGKRIAQIAGATLNAEAWASVNEWARKNQIQCLYFLAEPQAETMRLGSELRFQLVDVRLTLEKRLAAETLGDPSAGSVRPFRSSDLPTLRALAGRLHRDSRFFADSRFSEERSQALFETWIEKDAREGMVFVAEMDSEPVGYSSCRLRSGGEAQIGLVGVAESAQGRGFGKALVNATLRWCASQSAASVSVVTQGRNVAAQRLYQGCGFLTQSLRLWYHLWLDQIGNGDARPHS